MQTRLLWRRSATAIGLYGGVVLPLLAGVVAARHLSPADLARYLKDVLDDEYPPARALADQRTLVAFEGH